MCSDAWPQYCRAALVRSVAAAAAQFPGPGEDAPKPVHVARRTLKEARAIARLFRRCVGESARVTTASLAATRRQIGRARDLDVMAHRLKRLAAPAEVSESLMAAIESERQAARRARRGLSASAPRARLNAIVRRVEGWDFSGDDPEALHAFRARVVDLRYQLALLACAWPEALNAQAEGLDELREALGDFHDLQVLAIFAAERGRLAPEALEELKARIAPKQRKLKRRAKAEFDRLFAETASAFGSRLAAYLAQPVMKPTAKEDEPAAAQSEDVTRPA